MGYYASAIIFFSIIFCFVLYNIIYRTKYPKNHSNKYTQRQRKKSFSTKPQNHYTRSMAHPTPQKVTKKSYLFSGNIISHQRFQRKFTKTFSAILIRKLFSHPKKSQAIVLPFQASRRTGQESEEVQL